MSKKTERIKKQSPELSGGAGFTFEDSVSSVYAAALLAEGYAPGIENCIVYRVALQQRNFGEPLDDLIVDFRGISGVIGRLSLQVKRTLVISAANTNDDFREVIRDSWATFQKDNFQKGIDKYGVAVGEIAMDVARDLISLCELARSSSNVDHFNLRFNNDTVNKKVRRIHKDIITLLNEFKGTDCSEVEIHEFFTHFLLINFDFIHAGATDPPEILTRLRNCLHDDHLSQASALWGMLCKIVRESSGKSGEFFRPELVKILSRSFHLRVAPSLRESIEKLTELTKIWIVDIQNDIGGTHLNRSRVEDKLKSSLEDSRFVQIVGLPGSGKSVLLRQQIEIDLSKGPVFFLKSDRLEGKGWKGFAKSNGISDVSLEILLNEIAAFGNSKFYIDGIDRVEKDHQLIVLDVIRAILASKLLSNWQIIVTLRHSGIEPLRNWLGELYGVMSASSVEVDLLDEDEAEELSIAKPSLMGLLFGPKKVREIVRRPFFAKILSQSFGSGNTITFNPSSEVDLIENWWDRGGYDAYGQNVIHRQRGIIELAGIRARQLSGPLSLRHFSSNLIALIDQFIIDGILYHVRRGHTVQFAHDIFFEWSFFHVLADRGDGWIDEILECGQPPAVGRAVELLSQWEYDTSENWGSFLGIISVKNARSQWLRAWLLGPIGSAAFEKNTQNFIDVVSVNDYRFFKMTLVWFQAEKTIPNSSVLSGDLPKDQRIPIADILGWPSDVALWRRLIDFLIGEAESLPVFLLPHVVLIFDVWQNAFFSVKNRISEKILSQCSQWLEEIEYFNEVGWNEPKSLPNILRWQSLDELSDFKKSLVKLILQSASSQPNFAEAHLRQLVKSRGFFDEGFKQVANFSRLLSETHSELLADYTITYLKEPLLESRLEKQRRKAQIEKEHRKREAESSEGGDNVLARLYSLADLPLFFSNRVSFKDSEKLAIRDDTQNFWPPSPLREPFSSLFNNSSKHALRLLTELCNHAVAEWRQYHIHSFDSPGIPLPVEIEFPWGIQQFWGGEREYLWYRGLWAPHPLACAFLACEDWCFAELERGRAVDELIREIVYDNKSVAILGVAVALAIQTNQVSEIVFSILTCQWLWSADRNRVLQEVVISSSNKGGFTGQISQQHINAIDSASKRKVRSNELRSLTGVFLFDKDFSDRIRDAIHGFKDKLPYEMEAELSDPDCQKYLTNQALNYTALVARANYRDFANYNDGKVNDLTGSDKGLDRAEQEASIEPRKVVFFEDNLWVLATKAFEDRKIDKSYDILAAISLARRLDNASLFAVVNNNEIEMRRGGVAAIASVVLQFPDERTKSEIEWARDVMIRASNTPENPDSFGSLSSIIPWHHGLFVVRGIASDLKLNGTNPETAGYLLKMVSHSLESVSLSAIEEIVSLWPKDPKFVWAALTLAFTLCRVESSVRTERDEYVQKALDASIDFYRNGEQWLDLPLPPDAWVKIEIIIYKDIFDEREFIDENPERWEEPSIKWRSKYGSKVLVQIPYELIFQSKHKDLALRFIAEVLRWTIDKISPPWMLENRKRYKSSGLFEWIYRLGDTVGSICGLLPFSYSSVSYLGPIFELEDEDCWKLLSPLVNAFINKYIYFSQAVSPETIQVLDFCLRRFLSSHRFTRQHHRGGHLDLNENELVQSFLFVSRVETDSALRYANGDWSEISLVLPLVDRTFRAVGRYTSIMDNYLTLCERSKVSYPAEIFADHILSVMTENTNIEDIWHNTGIPARVANLIQEFGDRETPMVPLLAQKFLRILDSLIDMGDRRSAALQLSEAFREVKATGP